MERRNEVKSTALHSATKTNDNMDYILQKELHTRSLSILELREKAIKRLRDVEDDLYQYEKKSKLDKIYSFYGKSDYEWRVKVCTRSLSFIEGMYERHMWKIRDTIPWKTFLLMPGCGLINSRNEYVQQVDYCEQKKGYVIDHRFTLPDIEPDYSPIVLKSDRVAGRIVGLVEPVDVPYDQP